MFEFRYRFCLIPSAPRLFHHNLGPTLVVIKSFRILRTRKLTDRPRQTLQYWRRKESDPSFHPRSWGGSRSRAFNPETMGMISVLIWQHVAHRPCTSLAEIKKMLLDSPWRLEVSSSWIQRLFSSWKWSWKRPVQQNLVFVLKYKSMLSYISDICGVVYFYRKTSQSRTSSAT